MHLTGLSRPHPAPDFELPDQDGVLHRLSTMLHKGPVAIFFYPVTSSEAGSGETRWMPDGSADFLAAGAQRLGISRDWVDGQLRCAEDQGVDFPLLSDADGSVCAAYGVGRSLATAPVRRHTVVVGTDCRLYDVVTRASSAPR